MSFYPGEETGSFSDADLQGDVIADTPCRKCSYNLRGLPKDGRCPECGAPIGVSIWGSLLRFSHPRWLKEVSEGAMLILWGLLVSVVVSFVASIIMRNEPVIRQVLVTLGTLVGVIGTWQMTTPDPSGIGEAPGLTARKLVRIAVICGVIANVGQLLLRSGIDPLLLACITGLCGLVGLVGEFAKLHYIGLLAARLPDDALRDRAHFLKWAIGICYGAFAVIGILAVLAAASMGASMMAGGRPAFGASAFGGLAAVGCSAMVVGVVLLVFAIMALILIYKVAQAIKSQIPLSIELWNRNAQRAQAAKAAKAGGAAPALAATAAAKTPADAPPAVLRVAKRPTEAPPPPTQGPAQDGNQRPYF